MTQQWKPIESAPKDGTPIIIACIGEGRVYDVCNGHIEVVQEDEQDGAWGINGGEPFCSYVGRPAGEYFCCWLPGKEWEDRWKIGPSFEYTHWMPLPAAPGSPKAITCTEERPCLPCYLDQGECTAPPASAQDDAKDEKQADACPRCDGSGEITVMSDSSPDAHDVVVCCDHCQGSGAAVDAAKFLASALSGEKYRHMQVWAEYRNFHRSLCARFGYSHDEVHFRRDLVSLEEAIAAKVAAPAAGGARDAERLDWLEQHDGRFFNKDRISSIVGVGFLVAGDPKGVRHQAVRDAIDAALAASQQQEG